MTARLVLALAALLALAACGEDFSDMMGIGPRDGAEYGPREAFEF